MIKCLHKFNIWKTSALAGLLLVCFSVDAYAQNTISGTVSDATSGESLPGVNILLKANNDIGTATDLDGYYELNVPSLQDTLVFSYIGYQTTEIPISGRTEINLPLERQLLQGEELVVVGYGTSREQDVTGSITRVREESFNSGIATAPEQLMQGKLSGVDITLGSGRPGAGSTVRIRGGTSISASNAPLYVVDGVPVGFSGGSYERSNSDRMTRSANNPLNVLNPNDIESIDVLKDASAAAIYGSRGANGVILITTKKGRGGATQLNYSTYMGVSSVRKKIDLLSADQYRNFLNENSETIGEYQDGGVSTDWQDQIYQTGVTQSHDIALSGGSEQTSYRASINYMNQQGVLISSRLEKLASRLNVNHSSLSDRLNLNLNLTNTLENNNYTPNTNSAGGDTEGGIIRDALRFNPTYPVKNDDGEYTFLSDFNLNPVEQADLIQDEGKTFRSLGNLTADLEITDWLAFNTNVGFTYESMDRNYYAPKASVLGARANGQASQEARENTSSLIETNLELIQDINRHSFTFLAGYSWQQFIYTNTYLRANGFVTDLTSFNNLDGAVNFMPPQTGKSSNKLISFFGRANYDFDNRYLLTVTLRRDGSSRFGANEKWGLFPSASLAWRLTEEDFMSEISYLSNLKVRLGYGITGNEAIGNYRTVPTLTAGTNKYIIGGEVVTAVGPNQLANPDLKWEETTQINAGVDFGFFNQRLTGSLDYYQKTTNDLLLTFQVPNPAVVNTTTANVGEVYNEGFELELSGQVLQSSDYSLEAFGNYSINDNEVVSLSNDTYGTEEIITGFTGVPGFVGVNTSVIAPGQPLGTWYGYEYIGVDENGLEQYRDVNGDGQITPGQDRKVIGNSQPDFHYGFGFRGNVKRFNYDIFFRGVKGKDIFNATALDIQRLSNLPGFNVSQHAVDDGVAYSQNQNYSSRWIQDASYLRLENVTVGYTFDTSSLNWLGNLNVYVTGQNLFVLTDYTGFDPEVDSRDGYTYPRPRTLLMGLKLQL
ncbi:MAG: SusC/RagA family TonB-linked outer membrane protein [Bacteroidetes bacterium]|jgi:iron complex outermembrane receptor protein|nr:SusC/RagA family TonB-linked outer membrane protein [Bacteroidota bacterium]